MQRSGVFATCGIGCLVIGNNTDYLAVQSDYVLRARPVVRLIRKSSRCDIRIKQRQPVRISSSLSGIMHTYALRS